MNTVQSGSAGDCTKAFELLGEASRQYEAYVEIARLAASSALCQAPEAAQRSWSHPMGVVIGQLR